MFVQAVLVDPVLDFVVCDLNYGPQQATSGNKTVNGRDTTLPPQVTIARANGEIIGQGPMDFG
jgi:hypothetical protein